MRVDLGLLCRSGKTCLFLLVVHHLVSRDLGEMLFHLGDKLGDKAIRQPSSWVSFQLTANFSSNVGESTALCILGGAEGNRFVLVLCWELSPV